MRPGPLVYSRIFWRAKFHANGFGVRFVFFSAFTAGFSSACATGCGVTRPTAVSNANARTATVTATGFSKEIREEAPVASAATVGAMTGR